MKTMLARSALALVTVWVTLDMGATKAVPLPDWCTSTGALDAEALPATLPAVEGCDLTGRLVRYGDIGVIVPERGQGVAHEQLLVNGFVELDVDHPLSGIVHIHGSARVEDLAGRVKRLMQPENPNPCAPEAASGYAHHDTKVYSSFVWRYNPVGEPASVAGAALSRIVAGANAVTNGFNDCGITDIPNTPAHVYAGATTRRPEVAAICPARDGVSVVGWEHFGSTTLASVCRWKTDESRTPRVLAEADTRFNADKEWIVDTTLCIPGVDDAFDLQSTATHEWGHVFSLQHVPADGATATQTMASPSARPCNHTRRTLGIGDVNGLLKWYGKH